MKDSMGVEHKYNEWTSHVWPGNPDMVKEAYVKTFVNRLNYNRKLNIWVWKYDDHYNFTVSTGRNSDFSYTGMAPMEYRSTAHMSMNYIDNNLDLVIK
jgi:hypothetical protein